MTIHSKPKSDPNEPRFLWSAARKRAIEEFHNLMLLSPQELVKSCLNCDNFNEQSETCVKFNARPPARIIAYSCDEWENLDDELPF